MPQGDGGKSHRHFTFEVGHTLNGRRTVSASSYRGARLNEFRFVYTTPSVRSSRVDQTTLSFEVKPASMPPTNIHVLIGRNGVGKTHMLNNMSRAVIDKEPDESQVGIFECVTDDKSSFANLVSVTFSAFDPFEPLPNRKDRLDGLPCAYVGLKRSGKTKMEAHYHPNPPKNYPKSLGRVFWYVVKVHVSPGGAVPCRCLKRIRFSNPTMSRPWQMTRWTKRRLGSRPASCLES